jgi:C4-dicarboxylate-specific signal transduction histidine kinase
MKTDLPIEPPELNAAASSSLPKWWRLYFVLAAFDLVTISFSLYLNHRLMGIHDESVRVNQEWAAKLSRFSDLAQLGGEVNAPGNDVFDSRDVDTESARMRASLARFDQELTEAEGGLLHGVPPAHAKLLQQDVASVRAAMREMVDEANLIFSYFGESQPGKAGERMATMDRKYAKLNGRFAQLSRHIRDIQTENFIAQQAASTALRNYEFLIAGAIVLMVLTVTIYGHRMARAMAKVMQEKGRYMGALHEAHEGLEQHVQERTKELRELTQKLREEINRRERAQKEMEETQARLVVASRQAGMAEAATGVLHNVGNVLNSISVSAHLVTEQVQKSKSASVAKLSKLLTDHAGHLGQFLESDPKGQQVLPYLDNLAEQLTKERAALLQELDGLIKSVTHVKEVISVQQRHATVTRHRESISLETLIEDALRMNAVSFERNQVQVRREFQDVSPVCVDKNRVLQILINLIRNANQAMEDVEPTQRHLTLRLGHGLEDRIFIAVLDSGVGIAPESLSKIFQHGFTTKKLGHGFGLHSSAISAKEMDGSLSVHSDGLGLGATFTLELPVSAPQSLAA